MKKRRKKSRLKNKKNNEGFINFFLGKNYLFSKTIKVLEKKEKKKKLFFYTKDQKYIISKNYRNFFFVNVKNI